jgi:uncharacterized protein
MKSPRDAALLRAFLSENDKSGGLPLYEAIVLKAREMHMDGATVLRGPIGFGRSRRIHAAKVIQLVYDLPIVVEIVDSQDKINSFLPALEQLMSGGIVTIEKISILRYGSWLTPLHP